MNARSIFDFHARFVPRPDARDELLDVMDTWGIERAVISSGGVIDPDTLARQVMVGGFVTDDADNEAVRAASEDSHGRLVPFFFGNPHREGSHYRERAHGFSGLELSPAVHGVPLTDERNLALVRVAAEFGHAVYVVCLGSSGFDADELVALAETFPEVDFVLGHCGFVGVDLYSLDRIRPCANILAEMSGCYTKIAATAVRRLGARRVLFGTEYPLQHPEVELAKLRALDLEEGDLDRVVWTNAHRLIGEGSL